MKCPHCEYKDGWDPEAEAMVEGEHGAFWEAVVMFHRSELSVWRGVLAALPLTCPSCNVTFLDPY